MTTTRGWRLLDPHFNEELHHDTAIILRLPQERIEDLRRANKTQLVTGPHTTLQYGKQCLDITVKKEQHTNELYSHSGDDLAFLTNISHRAVVKAKQLDEALLALKESQAQLKHQKRASQTHVATEIVPEPKSRFEAAKRSRQDTERFERRLGSPALTSTTPVLAPTSAFHDPSSTKTRAVRHAVVHLLAMRPLSLEDVAAKVRLPVPELKPIVSVLARQDAGKWDLTDKIYKELDVWRFKYAKESDRQAAIDHAVRAYDRLRLSKDDNLWQLLLPKAERGQGKVLSRLHLGQGTAPRQTSPQSDHASSAVNSPRLGSQPAHKTVINRLLSKDPKKARAVEEAKDKKRKDRLAADERKEEERSAKRQATEDRTVKRAAPDSKRPATSDNNERPTKRVSTANLKKKSQEKK